MNNKIFSYCNYNYKNYSIKELVFNKLKLNSDFKIETLKDIEQLSISFLNHIPYCTFDAGVGKDIYDIDYTVSCIENGGICTQLNIIFGLLLKEIFNFEIYLMKSVEHSNNNIIKEFGWHFYNVFKWNDNKVYYHDVGLFKFNVFSPLEINNYEFTQINNPSLPQPFEHRIILNPNEINNNNNSNGNKSYILQRKYIDKGIVSIIELKLNINKLEDNVTFKKIYEISNNFYKVKTRLILKYTSDGIASLNNKSFIYWLNNNNVIVIKIKENYQYDEIFLNYFNINLKDNNYYKNYIYVSKL